jgi:hypothetical protein
VRQANDKCNHEDAKTREIPKGFLRVFVFSWLPFATSLSRGFHTLYGRPEGLRYRQDRPGDVRIDSASLTVAFSARPSSDRRK